MIKILAFTILLSLFMVFNSCTCKYHCPDDVLWMVFVNYKNSELDTIVIKAYKADGKFDNFIGTDTFITDWKSYSMVLDTLADTLYPGNRSLYKNNYAINADFDYQIILASSHKMYSITGILSNNASVSYACGHSQPQCINDIIAYKMDGQLIKASNLYFIK